MFGWLCDRLLKKTRPPDAAVSVPTLKPEQVGHLWTSDGPFPRIDWDLVWEWIAQQSPEPETIHSWRRAVFAAYLDAITPSLKQKHSRWRSMHAEGLSPVDGKGLIDFGKAIEHACRVLHRDLRGIRGDTPIAPLGVVALSPQSAYIDFTDGFIQADGEYATSGGMYIAGQPHHLPLIAICATFPESSAAVIAHELTHHALFDCLVPPWIEEGLAQMMESRVAGGGHFIMDAEMLRRQRALWRSLDVESFLSGASFLLPEADAQELSYHLAQWLVRAELTRRPDQFFRFVRACREGDTDEQCRRFLGCSTRDLVLGLIGIDG